MTKKGSVLGNVTTCCSLASLHSLAVASELLPHPSASYFLSCFNFVSSVISLLLCVNSVHKMRPGGERWRVQQLFVPICLLHHPIAIPGPGYVSVRYFWELGFHGLISIRNFEAFCFVVSSFFCVLSIEKYRKNLKPFIFGMFTDSCLVDVLNDCL